MIKEDNTLIGQNDIIILSQIKKEKKNLIDSISTFF